MVYVDSLAQWGTESSPRCFRTTPSCHMYADTRDELHKMALKIGLKRAWFQDHPMLAHYDLVPSKRQLAVSHGAVEHNRKQAVRFWLKQRREHKSA